MNHAARCRWKIGSVVALDNKEWIEDCRKWHGRILTGEKRHWCFDWDGLPVDETTPDELDCCNCLD